MPTKAPKTLAGTYGTEAAELLAQTGLELLTARTRDRARIIRGARFAANRLGVPWRVLRAADARERRELAGR